MWYKLNVLATTYTRSVGCISNTYVQFVCVPHSDSKFYFTILNMQVLCKVLFYGSYITGVYGLLYSAVHPMKYLDSDVMWCKSRYENTYSGKFLRV